MTLGKATLSTLVVLAFWTNTLLTDGQAQNSGDTITSAPLAPPPDRAPPPAGVSLTLPDGSPTLVPGSEQAAEPFRIGVLSASAPGDRQDLLAPFARHMELSLNRPVEFIPFREARGLVTALQQRTISYAIAPGSVLAATHARCECVMPLATQPNTDGSTGLFSVVIAPMDGTVRTLDDIRAERLIVVGQGSVVAHQIGLSDLFSQGVTLNPDEELMFASSLAEAIDQIQTGNADAVLSWTRQADGAVLFSRPPAHQLDDETRASLRIIWRSRPILGLSHYTHRDLDETLLNQLRDLLIHLTGTDGEAFFAIDQGSGRPFIATTIADYAPHMDALRYWSR